MSEISFKETEVQDVLQREGLFGLAHLVPLLNLMWREPRQELITSKLCQFLAFRVEGDDPTQFKTISTLLGLFASLSLNRDTALSGRDPWCGMLGGFNKHDFYELLEDPQLLRHENELDDCQKLAVKLVLGMVGSST